MLIYISAVIILPPRLPSHSQTKDLNQRVNDRVQYQTGIAHHIDSLILGALSQTTIMQNPFPLPEKITPFIALIQFNHTLGSTVQMRRFARFGIICTILKTWKHPWRSVTFIKYMLLPQINLCKKRERLKNYWKCWICFFIHYVRVSLNFGRVCRTLCSICTICTI